MTPEEICRQNRWKEVPAGWEDAYQASKSFQEQAAALKAKGAVMEGSSGLDSEYRGLMQQAAKKMLEPGGDFSLYAFARSMPLQDALALRDQS